MNLIVSMGDQRPDEIEKIRSTRGDHEAYGAVDELTAALGLARAFSEDQFVTDQILAVQKDLIVVMGELATASEDTERYLKDGFKQTSARMVDRIGEVIAKAVEKRIRKRSPGHFLQ